MVQEQFRRSNRVTLVAFLILMAVLLWANFWMMAPYLLSVAMGAILSLVLRRFFMRLEPRIGRSWAALAVTIGVALLVVAPILIFGILAITQAIETAQTISQHPGLSIHTMSRLAARSEMVRSIIGSTSEVEAQAREAIKSLAGAAPPMFFAVFGGVPEFVLKLVLALISCYFFLLDGQTFLLWLRDKLPLDPEVRATLFNSFRDTAASTLVATLTAASIQTLIVSLGFVGLGVPAAFLAGGATFILAWVPLVGSSPVWLSASIYLLVQGRTVAALAMLGVGFLTGISDNFVYPWVLKGRAEMHSLVSLVAVFGGIYLFGILGVFFGPILASLLVAVLNIWPVVAARFGLSAPSTIVDITVAET